MALTESPIEKPGVTQQGVEARRVALQSRLLSLLRTVDPAELLASACLGFAGFDPETYNESEDEYFGPELEYIALQTLGVETREDDGAQAGNSWDLACQAMAIAQELFHLTSLKTITAPSLASDASPADGISDYAVRTQLESLGVRGLAYANHLRVVLDGCFGAFDDECTRLLGFTSREAVQLAESIATLINNRFAPRRAAAKVELGRRRKQLKRQRKGKSDTGLPPELRGLSPSAGNRHLARLISRQVYSDATSIVTVTAADLGAEAELPSETALAFLRAFTCPRDAYDVKFHSMPAGYHPLTERPIVEIDSGRFIVPCPSAMAEAFRPRIENLLREADASVWQRYLDHRSKWTNEEAIRRLRAALPGSKAKRDVAWRSPEGGSDLDGVIWSDCATLRLQTKSGRLHPATRRGAVRNMRRNLDELIKAAYLQHRALSTALELHGPSALGLKELEGALAAAIQIEVIVCLDDITVWAAQAHRLASIGVIDSDRPAPWILSLTDLMAVTDLLSGSEFVHYLLRRQRLEHEGRVMAHDELDWVGHYIEEGLFFDSLLTDGDESHQVQLLSYTDGIDAWYLWLDGARKTPVPKPTQKIPANLRRIIERLETRRPKDWLFVAVCLLDGDDRSRTAWADAIDHVTKRSRTDGWANVTQVFATYGLTLLADHRLHATDLRETSRKYATRKLSEDAALTTWIVLAIGGNGDLHIVVVGDRSAVLDGMARRETRAQPTE